MTLIIGLFLGGTYADEIYFNGRYNRVLAQMTVSVAHAFSR